MIASKLRCVAAALVAAVGIGACSQDNAPTAMVISAQKFVATEACWATMSMAEPVDPTVAKALGDVCSMPATAEVAGGSDLIRLVIDYGPDVPFTPGTAPPAPTVTMTLDGVVTPTGGSIVPLSVALPTNDDDRGVFLATFTAPAMPVKQMRFSAQAAQGFSATVVEPVQVDAPAVMISVEGCTTQACQAIIGTQPVSVDVSVPGNTAQTVTLTSYVNNVLQQGSIAVMASRPAVQNDVDVMTGTAFVPIPFAPDGSPWVLDAQWGLSQAQTMPAVTIRAPQVTALVEECTSGQACSLTSGIGDATIDLSVPANGPTSVVLTWAVDGVMAGASQTVQLTNLMTSKSQEVATGTAFVPVPAAGDGSTWQIYAAYQGSTSQVQPITLHAPVVSARVEQCPPTGPCSLTSGVGTAALDLTVPANAATSVVLTWAIDGEMQSSSQTVQLGNLMTSMSQEVASGTAYLPVPVAGDGSTWQIYAAYDGSTIQVSPITILAPVVSAKVEQCPATGPCALTGDVGPVALDLIVPAVSAATVQITSTLDGVTQNGSQMAQLTNVTMMKGSSVASGTVFVPVPSPVDGSTWQLFVQYDGTTTAVQPVMTLQAPAIGLAFDCGGSPCSFAAGNQVAVVVTAPVGSEVTTAYVSTAVNGVPNLVSQSLSLTQVNAPSGMIAGTLALTVPSSVGASWQIQASVGPYSATPLLSVITQ